MPLYEHRDKVTGKTVEILRDFSSYKETPSLEEAVAIGMTPEEYETASWERIIGRGIQMVRGTSWGGGKGNWVSLLVAGGGWALVIGARLLDHLI